MYKSHKKNKKYSPVPAVYLHIPFCREICPFCPFAVCKDHSDLHSNYFTEMFKEISMIVEEIRGKNKKESETHKSNGEKLLESIYVGGGTPSRLTIPELSNLLSKVRQHLTFSKNVEITFEMNPEDVSPEYLNNLAKIGVNRLSLGGQSFRESLLRKLGRCHDASDLRKACDVIVNSPFQNWNIDLMFGIPGQSVLMFKKDVEAAISYNPNHISLYGLEIHDRTPFGKNMQICKWVNEHHEQYEEMYLWAVNRLKAAGLIQYEVSNFSKKGNESRNNLLVWSGKEYLGFGAGAHSYYEITRKGNIGSVKTYVSHLKKNTLPVEFEEQLSSTQLALEFLMLGLRSCEGVNLQGWIERFELEWSPQEEQYVNSLYEQGHALKKDNHFCLTPKGMLLADSITVQMMPSNTSHKTIKLLF